MSAEVISLPMLCEDGGDGRDYFQRDWIVEIDGERFLCEEGMSHNGSSWPRCFPGPAQKKIRRAGAVHDVACQLGTHGVGGRKLGYMEANRLWYKVAIEGEHEDVRASKPWAWIGRIGLFVGCGPTWIRYRRADATAS